MKKLNKFFAVLVALAMMATLAVTSAFAADFNDDVNADGKVSNDASKAYLVKYLKIDEGVSIPNDTFNFNFTPVASDTVLTTDLAKPEYQALTPTNVKINTQDMTPSDSTKDDGALVKAIKISDLFTGKTWPKAGEYIYDVGETITNNTPTKGKYNNDTDLNTQNYRLRVFVEVKEVVVGYDEVTGEPITETQTVINKVTVQDETTKKYIEIDDPSVITTTTGGETTTVEKTQNQITASDVEGFTFVNEYKLDDAYIPDGPYGAFHTKKNTTGAYGDVTQAFPITVTVTFPDAYAKGDKALNLYKYVKDGEDIDLGALEATSNEQVWTKTIQLKDGEIAFFKNLPEGAKVNVSENLIGSGINNGEFYNQSTTSKEGDTDLAPVTTMYKVVDNEDVALDALKTKDSAVFTKITATDVIYHDANAKKDNNVEVTNDSVYEPSTTGILLSNLPYIVLALVAIGGMVAYVVIRRRQSDEA